MKLINVRKGQFVYYKNELHKVYAIQPFFKKSVHLVRLKDYDQRIVMAKEITYYKPKNLDSFIFYDKRFTLNKDVRAKVGHYILVINPKPDSLDDHHLHAIELVSQIEPNGVISNKSNGIKHHEYWVMEEGRLEGANIIDRQDQTIPEEAETQAQLQTNHDIAAPKIGHVYQKNDSNPIIQAMVVATEGRTCYLGNHMEVPVEEIMNTDKWTHVLNVNEQ
ncbi:hypothetical protein ACLIBG_14315 [Virgibacillus sp. W0181]|uniref:hypothetical protein n=1 Tax=Virgibacillus sp. W0181 TaxID=3391581 RepID=UPI003F4531B3